MAVTDLIRVQIGQEAAWGTPAVATAKLMGVTDANLHVNDVVHHVEKSGFMYPSPDVAQVALSGEGSISMDLSYEDIAYPLDNFFSQAVPVGTVYTYTAPTTAIVAPNHFTMEFGALDATATAEYEANGVLFTALNISGEAGSIWKGTFPFVAELVAPAVMTVLTDHAVELIQMSDTTIHFDAWGTAAGTAAASAATLVGFELNVSNGRHLKFFSGSINPLGWGDTGWSGTLKTTVEYNVAMKAVADAIMGPALVQRAIRIDATAPVTASYVYLDFYGTLVDGVELFSDRDGNITLELLWEGTFEPTVSDWLEIIVDNGVVALV